MEKQMKIDAIECTAGAYFSMWINGTRHTGKDRLFTLFNSKCYDTEESVCNTPLILFNPLIQWNEE